jgi:tetratricopeptide (TPR) repeat protein
MSDEPIFQEAQDAAMRGQRERAKDLLTRLLQVEKDNPELWLLMSSVVDSPKERTYCLQSVLRFDPDNEAAQRGLVLLGTVPPDESIEPTLPLRRKWEIGIQEEELTGLAKIMANPILRVATFAFAGLFIVGLVLLGIFAPRGVLFGSRSTITPQAWTPTPTLTETPTPLVRTPTLTPATAVPLWMLLDATYTPVPLYVNTPHPIAESYRSGLRSYERGDYETMLSFMLQAQRQEPEAADIHFYVGEAYRLQEEYDLAIEAYDKALEINPEFAPAILWKARVLVELNPRTNILDELESAIEFDPSYGDAYLELARYMISQDDEPEAILELLNSAEDSLANNAEFYFIRSQLKLAMDDSEGALADAIMGNELDITILDGYLVLGQAYLANDLPEESVEVLSLYNRYEDENPLSWAYLGWGYSEIGEYETAFESFERALELDDRLFEAHLYRGLTFITVGDTKAAINDLYLARTIDAQSFDANFSYAIALVADERRQESINFFDIAENLAISDRQLAMVYYNRALVYDAIGLPNRAKDDFNQLLLLPTSSVPRLWIARANQYLATATPTQTPSNTPTPSHTPTPTATFTVTPSPTSTFTPTYTPTHTFTPTPTRTPTPTFTLTPTLTATPLLSPTP